MANTSAVYAKTTYMSDYVHSTSRVGWENGDAKKGGEIFAM